MKKNCQIICPKTPLYQSLEFEKEIETECLFGEYFLVSDEFDGWSFGTLLTDNYKGWLKTNALGPTHKNNYIVISKSSNIYSLPNAKSTISNYLSVGSQLYVKKINKGWAEIQFFNYKKKCNGFVPYNHLGKVNEINKNWIKFSKQLLNIPYVWGGRSCSGIDCSALLQLSIKCVGINLPRNTNEQILFMKSSSKFKLIELDIIKKLKVKKGFIIYWPKHVGIISKKNTLLHANAHQMSVCEENFYDVFDRLRNKNVLPTHIFELINI